MLVMKCTALSGSVSVSTSCLSSGPRAAGQQTDEAINYIGPFRGQPRLTNVRVRPFFPTFLGGGGGRGGRLRGGEVAVGGWVEGREAWGGGGGKLGEGG